jgi:hypothetical protein
VNAGSFSYTNTSGGTEHVGSIVVTVSEPEGLASLTATEGTQIATVAPVAATNTLTFNPPISLAEGETATFSLTAETAEGNAAIGDRFIYAGMLIDRSPIGPLGAGMMLLGVMLMPMGTRRRRRAIVMAIAAIALTVAVVGCGSSGGSAPAPTKIAVSGDGHLKKAARLSTIDLRLGGVKKAIVQKLTAVDFD